jgi:hypothetical protein
MNKRDPGHHRNWKPATNKKSGSWEFVSLYFGCEFKTPLIKFVKTEAFWIEFSFFGHVVLKLALQTMAGTLSNFFDVSFYAFIIILQMLSKIHSAVPKQTDSFDSLVNH